HISQGRAPCVRSMHLHGCPGATRKSPCIRRGPISRGSPVSRPCPTARRPIRWPDRASGPTRLSRHSAEPGEAAMTRWVITYNKDHNTSALEIESPNTPPVAQAVRHTLRMARQRYEEQEPSEVDEDLRGPAVLLAERFGITITGITQA